MFEHNALDALSGEQVRKNEAGGSGADDGDLCAHATATILEQSIA
jgi:hypothetical protein